MISKNNENFSPPDQKLSTTDGGCRRKPECCTCRTITAIIVLITSIKAISSSRLPPLDSFILEYDYSLATDSNVPLSKINQTKHMTTIDVIVPPNCTVGELAKVRSQLDPEICNRTRNFPFRQKCSFTVATRCPDTSKYLEKYYTDLQTEYIDGNKENFDPFVAFSVGCNKGFDALNTLRMGTFDASLQKKDWGNEMVKENELHKSVCAQDVTPVFPVNETIDIPRKGEVHCFEPMSGTFKKLKSSSEVLGYDKKGFKTIHGAVDRHPGKAYFPSSSKVGIENQGLDQSTKLKGSNEEVEVLSLKDYVKNNIPNEKVIHILQIDVEGYDGNVLLGSGREVLSRVEYLEFEYNWMGPWKSQNLNDIIDMLDDNDFTCYWTGKQKLWRITGCWQDYFNIHHWSNIGCVNRKRVPKLLESMEHVFHETIKSN